MLDVVSLCAQGPADQAVEEVHAILRAIVNMVLNGEDCVALQRYIVLKREIMTTAAGALDGMRDDARKMVAGMVEMERSYLTAEVFREILASSHAVDELSEEVHVRHPLCAASPLADGLYPAVVVCPQHGMPKPLLVESWLLPNCMRSAFLTKAAMTSAILPRCSCCCRRA